MSVLSSDLDSVTADNIQSSTKISVEEQQIQFMNFFHFVKPKSAAFAGLAAALQPPQAVWRIKYQDAQMKKILTSAKYLLE